MGFKWPNYHGSRSGVGKAGKGVLLVRPILRPVRLRRKRLPFWSLAGMEGATLEGCGEAWWEQGSVDRNDEGSYEKTASTTRPLSSGRGWSGPGVKVTPEPARVVASWKIGLKGAFGLRATTDRVSFVST